MPLIATILLFGVFCVNVALGSFYDSRFLNDVGEMLVLSGVAVLFVIAIIQKESAEKNKPAKTVQGGQHDKRDIKN